MQNKLSIRPQVTMLSVLKHIEYQTWFALAEFIDNAIDSYLKNEAAIKEIEGENFQLEVKVEINEPENRITIRDNAGGIGKSDYPRAFRAAEVPPDNSGLSEFGMGMKSAACWFADNWCVTTTALGEDNVKKVVFDMQRIFEDKLEELDEWCCFATLFTFFSCSKSCVAMSFTIFAFTALPKALKAALSFSGSFKPCSD